ncbi:MAG: DHH family phosphoesterase [Flavobacteriales bacterium]|nr:DHH family phosphoesterase [Flavobacteriales bacterium]
MSNQEKMQKIGSKVMDEETTSRCWEKTNNAQRIVIVAHRSPDGDAVGSTLALWNHLDALGIQATVALPDGSPHFLNWMNGFEKVLFHDRHPQQVEKLIETADVVWCLDFNGPSRVGMMEDAIRASQAFKIVVDHHQFPESFADVLLSDPTCGSTCEMIYGLIEAWGQLENVSQETAACVYAGMMTDTGSFRFNSVTSDTHRILAFLLDCGVDHSLIHELVYDSNRVAKIQLNGYAMSEKLKLWPEYGVAVVALDAEELLRFDYQSGDTEGLVNQALSIEGIRMAIFMKEADDGRIKMSLRSKGELSVRDISAAHFHGGGHHNAAGGVIENGSMLDAVKLVESLIPSWFS